MANSKLKTQSFVGVKFFINYKTFFLIISIGIIILNNPKNYIKVYELVFSVARGVHVCRDVTHVQQAPRWTNCKPTLLLCWHSCCCCFWIENVYKSCHDGIPPKQDVTH